MGGGLGGQQAGNKAVLSLLAPQKREGDRMIEWRYVH